MIIRKTLKTIKEKGAKMIKIQNWIIPSLILFTSPFAQDVKIEGQGTTTGTQVVLQSKNTSTSSSDIIGVRGLSEPQPNWGIGGEFKGGYMGIRSYATKSGTGNRYGAYIGGTSGSNNNYGIFTYGSGNNPYGIYAAAYGSNGYAGYFSGNVTVTGTFSNPSDEKIKKNIRKLDGNLEKLRLLAPKKYEFKRAEYPELNLSEGENYGLIAQEVETVFPNLVGTKNVTHPDPNNEKSEGKTETIKTINYLELIPVLIGAVNEQQVLIEELQAEINSLKAKAK